MKFVRLYSKEIYFFFIDIYFVPHEYEIGIVYSNIILIRFIVVLVRVKIIID